MSEPSAGERLLEARRLLDAMRLTAEELRLLLRALAPTGGWADDPAVATLQAKLSIMLEAAATREAAGRG